MFGPGIYLTECSSKADEYSHDGPAFDGVYAVLVCRAVIGKPFVTTTPGGFSACVLSGEYDSVLGDRREAVGTYREFVFFNEASIYPEYLVRYRRVYQTRKRPPRKRFAWPQVEQAMWPPSMSSSMSGLMMTFGDFSRVANGQGGLGDCTFV